MPETASHAIVGPVSPSGTPETATAGRVMTSPTSITALNTVVAGTNRLARDEHNVATAHEIAAASPPRIAIISRDSGRARCRNFVGRGPAQNRDHLTRSTGRSRT